MRGRVPAAAPSTQLKAMCMHWESVERCGERVSSTSLAWHKGGAQQYSSPFAANVPTASPFTAHIAWIGLHRLESLVWPCSWRQPEKPGAADDLCDLPAAPPAFATALDSPRVVAGRHASSAQLSAVRNCCPPPFKLPGLLLAARAPATAAW